MSQPPTNKTNWKRIAKWIGVAFATALAGLLNLSCTSLPSFGGGGDAEPAPPEDVGAQLVEALPEIADAGSRLLSTFVWTAVVIAVVFPAARVAAVGVFIAFYDRVASWFRPKPGSFTKPESSVNRTDEQ